MVLTFEGDFFFFFFELVTLMILFEIGILSRKAKSKREISSITFLTCFLTKNKTNKSYTFSESQNVEIFVIFSTK